MRFVRFRFDRMLAVFFWLSVSQTLGVVYKEASSVNFSSADMRRSLFWVVIHPLGLVFLWFEGRSLIYFHYFLVHLIEFYLLIPLHVHSDFISSRLLPHCTTSRTFLVFASLHSAI